MFNWKAEIEGDRMRFLGEEYPLGHFCLELLQHAHVHDAAQRVGILWAFLEPTLHELQNGLILENHLLQIRDIILPVLPYLETLQSSMQEFLPLISRIKEQLKGHGYTLCGDESLKITIDASAFGYTGDQLAEILLEKGVISEFHDPDYLVLMCTPENTEEEMMRVCQALCSIECRPSITGQHPDCKRPEKAMSVREAVFSPTETIPIVAAEGRILAQSTVGCPPAIPIVMSGERIGADAVRLMQYYGIETCSVVK